MATSTARPSYTPDVPPQDITEGSEADRVLRYLRRELDKIARAPSNTTFFEYLPLNVAPTKPRSGMVVYADGTNWNPGSGEGLYEYTIGGSWVFLAVQDFSLSKITASLGADVLLNNVANYFDGPSVAQGTSGTWFVSGVVTVVDTAVAYVIDVKLWDGTTIIASAATSAENGGFFTTVTLSGVITSPVGNLRISVKDISATTGKILFNQSGNSKDSTLTAVRIA